MQRPALRGRYAPVLAQADAEGLSVATATRWIHVYSSLISTLLFEWSEGAFGLASAQDVHQEIPRLEAHLEHWRSARRRLLDESSPGRAAI